MKYVLVLLMCVLAGVATAEKDVIRIPPNILQTALNCLAETGVNPEVLPQFGNPHMYDKNNDKRVHKFINCTFTKVGYAKKNGHVRIDRVTEVLSKDIDANKRAGLKKVMEECNKENGSDAAETTFRIFGCFIKNSPVKLSLS
ncbi:uncharacterized protein LOC128677272 [Plodia interpunctella]|uniref:uncharacterized protein LOC128677272 n=1 Tax=Plodia interpunctella TaxID=58824 RepID=UPI002367AB54|nr:uncharacterized protein LOC128677272 [Plodia interpunctella]